MGWMMDGIGMGFGVAVWIGFWVRCSFVLG